jgi:hypothetical protein
MAQSSDGVLILLSKFAAKYLAEYPLGTNLSLSPVLLHYDWSDPNRAVLTTTDSNVWGGASGRTYTRQPNGTTRHCVVVVRGGKNLKGRMRPLLIGWA